MFNTTIILIIIIFIILFILYLIYKFSKKIEKFGSNNFFVDILDETTGNIITPEAWYLFDEKSYIFKNYIDSSDNIVIQCNTNYGKYKTNYLFKRWNADFESKCLHNQYWKSTVFCTNNNTYKGYYLNYYGLLIRKDVISNNVNKIGKYALFFNGNSCLETINENDHVNLNNKSFTICWWSYLETTDISNGGRWIYTKYMCVPEQCGGYNRGNAIHMGYRKNGEFNFDFWGDEIKINVDIPNYHYNKWVFFAVTYDVSNNKRCIYYFTEDCNDWDLTKKQQAGFETDTAKGPLIPMNRFDNRSKVSIGCHANRGGFFIGQIANFRIYSGVALSLAQIKSIYNNKSYEDDKETVLNEYIELYKPKYNYEVEKYPKIYLNNDNQINVETINILKHGKNINCFKIFTEFYDIYFSSRNNDDNIKSPYRLFDLNIGNENILKNTSNINCEFENGTYDINGEYIGNKYYPINNNNNNINGEWIKINFKNNSFTLKTYGFIAIKGYEHLAPGCWELWGSNDDNNFNRIDFNIGDNDRLNFNKGDYNNFINYYGVDKLEKNNTSYKIYLFIFTKLAKGRKNKTSNNTLSFIEILMFGKS
jgi:hypothetical protein